MNPQSSLRRYLLTTLVVACVCLLPGGCVSRPVALSVPEPPLVWPGPPQPPRIRWEGQIRTSLDVVARKGLWQRFKDAVFGPEETGFVRPYGLTVDPDGVLWVTDPGAGRICRIDTNGKTFTVLGEGQGLLSPIGIAGDDTGRHYVTDSEKGAIYVLGKDNRITPLFSFVLHRPTGIAFSPRNGWLYVSETEAHEVVAFDRSGVERMRLGGRGNAPGRFNYPTDIWVDEGRLYVTDALNSRIQIFSLEGQFIGAFGHPGDTAGSFAKPKGIATDNEGHIYVCDALFDAVQIFDEKGQLLLAFGESGGGPGQFWMPSGLHIDTEDRIYVVDTYNRRIQMFRYLAGAAEDSPERGSP